MSFTYSNSRGTLAAEVTTVRATVEILLDYDPNNASVSDTVSTSDVMSLTLTKMLSESVSVADVPVVSFPKIISDTATVSEVLTVVNTFSRTFTDTSTVTDNISITLGALELLNISPLNTIPLN